MKTRFSPRGEKYFSTLADTYLSSRETDSLAKTRIRICIGKGKARDCHGSIEFLFSSSGVVLASVRDASPSRALLAKIVAGPIYNDEKEEAEREREREREREGETTEGVEEGPKFDRQEQTVVHAKGG